MSYQDERRALGDFIRRMRVHRGLSQYALARGLGLESAQSISNIERGVVALPRHHVKRMTELLSCDLDVFAYRMGQIEYYAVLEGVD